MSKLTAKQSRFVEEYLVDMNAAQAAIRAGYSKRTANKIGCYLLAKPHVVDAVAEARAALAERTLVKVDRVVQEFVRIGFADLRALFDEDGKLRPIHELDDDTAAALASVEVVTKSLGDGEVEYVHKVKAWDKPGTLDKLMRWLDGYPAERHKHSGPDGGPIPVSATVSFYIPDNGRDPPAAGPPGKVSQQPG